jgi:chemotaxis protein MotB
MARRAPAGAPAWLVTFADLMSLLVAFFVLIISFSVPDIQKLKIIAGSLRNAFGVSFDASVTGLIELDGEPRYKFARDLIPLRLEDVVGPLPDRGDDITRLAAREEYWARILEAEEEGAPHDASEALQLDQLEQELREAIRAVPELAAFADNLHFDRAPEGLRIQLLDQARMSMFPLGSAQMYEPTRKLLGEVVRAIAPLPHPIVIAGHTDSIAFRRRDGYDNWSLSLARADATRRVILEAGLPAARLASVSGKADTDHLFPEDPTDPRNRRISITLLRAPPEAQ